MKKLLLIFVLIILSPVISESRIVKLQNKFLITYTQDLGKSLNTGLPVKFQCVKILLGEPKNRYFCRSYEVPSSGAFKEVEMYPPEEAQGMFNFLEYMYKKQQETKHEEKATGGAPK